MTLILSNEEIEQLSRMKDLVPAIEEAYVELIEGRGANRLRSDIVTPTTQCEDGLYALKSMDGVIPKFGVGAIRINSDILTFPESGGLMRRVKMPAAPGNRYVGLVLLFSTHDGAPLLICPDGVMQRMRVGATSAVAAKYMAKKGSRIATIIGSGWQAGSQLLGLDAVFDLKDIRVFSPRQESREAFAKEMSASASARRCAPAHRARRPARAPTSWPAPPMRFSRSSSRNGSSPACISAPSGRPPPKSSARPGSRSTCSPCSTTTIAGDDLQPRRARRRGYRRAKAWAWRMTSFTRRCRRCRRS